MGYPIKKDPEANIKDHDDPRWSHYYLVARAFDKNDVGTKKKFFGFTTGHPTFRELLDGTAAKAKGMHTRIKIPHDLKKDVIFSEQVKRYWDLINSAGARILNVQKNA